MMQNASLRSRRMWWWFVIVVLVFVVVIVTLEERVCVESYSFSYTHHRRNSYQKHRLGHHPFARPRHLEHYHFKKKKDSFMALGLIPLTEFASELSFFSASTNDSHRVCIRQEGTLAFVDLGKDPYETNDNKDHPLEDTNDYVLGLAEGADLAEVARLTVDSFTANAITLSSGLADFSRLERAVLEPAVGLVNQFDYIMAYTEVFSGQRERMKHRLTLSERQQQEETNDLPPLPITDLLSPPTTQLHNNDDNESLSRTTLMENASGSSIFLILGRPRSPTTDNSSPTDVIASVELRLQPTDGKIPFSQPWLDKMERNMMSLMLGSGDETNNKEATTNHGKDLQPYLSNLCVASEARGRGVGKALVRCIQDIAKTKWGFSKLYLHVDLDNEAAFQLYKKEGFRDVGLRWTPFWAGNASKIGYFVKDL